MRHEFSLCLSRGLMRREFSFCLSRGLMRHVLSHPPGWMMDSPKSLIGEASVQGSRDAVGAFQSHAFRWNTARKGDEGHQVEAPRALVLNGSQRFQAMPKRFASQGLTHLADASLVPLQARGEQVARDPGIAHTGVGGVCILNVQRAVHRGLSFREGVLAQASAVRPRATPWTRKGNTHKQHGHRADNTHTLRGVRHDTQPHAVTHVSQQHAVRTHKHADARVTARTVQCLLKRCPPPPRSPTLCALCAR